METVGELEELDLLVMEIMGMEEVEGPEEIQLPELQDKWVLEMEEQED
jgi:hypothetical protein